MKLACNGARLQRWDAGEYHSNGQAVVALTVLGVWKILGHTHATNKRIQNSAFVETVKSIWKNYEQNSSWCSTQRI